jgi:CcmD family protein
MTLRRAFDRISTILLGFGTWLALTAPAVAQDFVKVDDAGREQLPATPFVGVAYGFIWVAVLIYIFSIARRLGRLQGELADLRRRIDRGGGDAPARR